MKTSEQEKGMTVDELIEALQEQSAHGAGDLIVVFYEELTDGLMEIAGAKSESLVLNYNDEKETSVVSLEWNPLR